MIIYHNNTGIACTRQLLIETHNKNYNQ